MVALILDERCSEFAGLFFLINQNGTGYIRDQCCHLQGEGASSLGLWSIVMEKKNPTWRRRIVVVQFQRVLVDGLNFRQHRPRNFRVSGGRDAIGVKFGHFVGALDEDAGEGRDHLVPVSVADEPVEDQLVGQDLGRVAAAQGTRYLKKIEA